MNDLHRAQRRQGEITGQPEDSPVGAPPPPTLANAVGRGQAAGYLKLCVMATLVLCVRSMQQQCCVVRGGGRRWACYVHGIGMCHCVLGALCSSPVGKCRDQRPGHVFERQKVEHLLPPSDDTHEGVFIISLHMCAHVCCVCIYACMCMCVCAYLCV